MEFYQSLFYQNPVPPKSGFSEMNSSKFLSTKVRICWNVFYQSPFYQRPVLPKSCWLQNDILLNSFLPKSCWLQNDILLNSFLPKSGSTKVRFYQSPVCLKMGFYPTPFYQSQFRPLSDLTVNPARKRGSQERQNTHKWKLW
jgi:hypothetical protein